MVSSNMESSTKWEFIHALIIIAFLNGTYGNPSPLDLAVSSLVREDQSFSAAALYQDKDVTYDFDFVVTNKDVNRNRESVYRQTTTNNFDVKVKVTSRDLTTTTIPSVDVSRQFEVTLSAGFENVAKQEIPTGSSVTIRGSTVINIDRAICNTTRYLCVGIEVSTDPAVLTDNQPLNNYACVKLEDWYLHACTRNTVDLRADVFDVVDPLVRSGGAVTVELLLWVELGGTAQTRPFRVQAYLCRDRTLDPLRDKQLEHIPVEFDQTLTVQTTSSALDLSGPGLALPDLHLEDSQYCGAVYLAVLIDGPGLGANNETNERNNVKITPLTILCPKDILSVQDFTYDLGQKQRQVYINTDTLLDVNVTVCNSHPEGTPFCYGRVNFRLLLYLCLSETFLSADGAISSGCIDVSMRGVSYCQGATPIVGRAVGECVRIECARMAINGTRFQTYQPYTHLMLMVLPPEGHSEDDEILKNNFLGLPIPISDSRITSSLKDHKISDDFGIPVDTLKVGVNGPVDYTDLEFEGRIIVGEAVSGTLVAQLYWSKDCRLDANDPLSGIPVSIEVTPSSVRLIKANHGRTEDIQVGLPADPSYCGTVCAIVYVESGDLANDNLERNKENQIATDQVTLQCHSTDEVALTEMWLVDPPTLTKDVKTPVTFTVTVSCTANTICNSSQPIVSTKSTYLAPYLQEQFHLELSIDSGTGAPESLVYLTSNNHPAIVEYSGDGLESDLTVTRRVTVTFTVNVTIRSTCLSRTQRLRVDVRPPDGSSDWPDNNHLTADLPLFKCIVTSTFDIEAGAVRLYPLNNEVRVSEAVPYDYSFKLHVKGHTLPAATSPHIRTAMVVSDDRKVTESDYFLRYFMPESHKRKLSAEWGTGLPPVELDDKCGFTLPADGLERFCDPDTGLATVYIGILLDSYDPDPEDSIRGQLEETLEQNNVAWTEAPVNVSGVKCYCNKPVQKQLIAELRSVVIRAGNPLVEVPVVQSQTEMHFSIEVGITNAHSEVLVPPDGQENFDLRVVIDHSALATPARIIILNSRDIRLLRNTPLEAGGTLVFTILGFLCHEADPEEGCSPENFLPSDQNAEDGCILHDEALFRVFFVASPDNYTTVDDTLGKRVICSGEAYVADPIFVGLPDLFWGSGGRGSGVSPWYAFHYTVRITRYKAALPTAADPPQPATFFLRFVSNGTEVLRTVQTPLTLTIAPGGSVTVSGLGIIKEELDEADCLLMTQSAYVQFVVTRTAGRPLPGLQNLGTPTTTCFPADMPEFTDMLVANMTLPEAVTEYGTSIDYTLWVEVDDRAASGNTSFTVDVYLATGPYLSHPHRLIRSFTGNGTTGFSSSSADEQLALAGERLAWFCYHRDVYLMAHVENNDPSPIDPESVRNTHAEPFYLYCQGDLLTLLAVDGLAAADGAVPLYHSPPGYTNVFVVRVTVANSDFKMRPTIETGLRNQPNFQVEFHYTHDDALWTTLENVKVKASHLPRLHAAIPLNGSVTVEVEVTFEITSALCNVLSSRNGKLRAIIYQGLGLRPGWVDSVPDNDVITYDVQCSEDIVDIFLDTDDPNYLKMDDVSQAGVFGHFAQVTGSFTISARIGNGQSLTTTASNLGYQLLLSRDDQQDDGDFELSVTVADQYKMVSDDAGTAEPDKKVIFGSAAFSGTIPLEVGCLYCGRVYLLIEVSNPDNSFGDPDLTNNAANISLTINCEEDLYAFWGGWWQGQTHFYPDKAVSVNFGGTVRLVGNGVTSVKTILPRHNFDIKVFAQRGSYFEWALATDLTPQSSWVLVPDEEGNLGKVQDPSKPFTFSRVSGSVLLTRGVCAEGADHLFIGVMTADAERDDSVLYNNFYVQPIHVIKHSQLGCGGQDSVDLEVKTHRNGETTFSLTDRSMTINANHSFELQLLITVEGEGWRTYWEAPPLDGKPVFEVIFTLSDGSYTVEIPHQVDYSLFNTGITRTTTVDLGGVLFLPEGGTLPLCGSTSARLNVLLDPKDHVLETDEGNNMGIITGLTVGGHICSRGFVYDLVAKDLQLAPIPKTWVQSDRADVNQPLPYCFTIESLALPGVASVSLPDALSYRFVVFPTASDDDVVFAENGRLHSTDTPTVSGNVFSWRVCGNLTVESDQADDGPLQLMCGLSPYLGVHLDPDVDDNPDNGVGDAPEVEDIANNIAKLQIKLNCPHISGFGLLEVVVKEGGLSDGVNDVLTVDFRPINKGSRTMLPLLDVYMYLRNDTSLPAEFNAPDLFHQLAPPLNPRPGYDHTWGTSEDRWYRDIDITDINVPVGQCEIAQYLCWELRSTNSTYDPRQDNYVCTPFDDSFYLDCIRDVSLTDLIVGTVQVAAIYQDTLIPITFNATVRMTGRTVPPPAVDGDSHIGVDFFLSADDTLDEAQDTLLADHQRALLDVGVTSSMSSGSVFRLAGRTEVYVSAAQCGGHVFVCARYVFLSTLTPPFREDGSTSNNDYDCFNVTEKMACNEETRDIEPTLFEVPRPYVLVGGTVPFDLHVKVDLRGTTTGGQVTFDSALYLSADAQLDNSDTHVPYPGWQLGIARLEQARHLSTGVHYLNLGGVPLNLTGLTDTTHCGPGYLLYVADVGMNVSERYEENNVIAAPIVIGCQGDVAGKTGMVDKLHVTKATLRPALLVAGQDSTVRVSGEVYNVWGRAVPRYQLSLRTDPGVTDPGVTDPGVTVTQDGAWGRLPGDNLLLLAPGERHRLNDLEVEVSSNLFTDQVCADMEHLVLCAMLPEDEDHQETYIKNNCMTLDATELTKMCSTKEYVDIRQLGLRVPPTFSLAGPVSVWHDVEVYVGEDAPTISTAQFLSDLHLSRSPHLDLATSHKLGDLPNNIGVPKNRRVVARVSQTDMTLTPPPAPADRCGLAYVHVRADALEEVDETREDNNGASRRVTLTCDHDYFSILDLNVETPEGRFIEDYNVAFQLAFAVTCSRTACSVSRSETSNVIFDLVYKSSNVTQAVTLVTVDENWDGQVTPGVGVGFHRPGLVRNFMVTGNLMIPNGSCDPNAHFYIGVQIGFGTSLLGQPTSVDGIPENDVVMVPYPCTRGLNLDGARDLVAMPVTFINTTVEQGHHIPANVYPGKPYHFTFDFGLYGMPLPVRDIALPAAPFIFDFCLSYDDRLDATDVCLGYVLTEGNAATLSRPVGSLPANVTLVENVQGLVFPATECGWRQLLIHLDNSSRIPEVSDINNVAARPIYINCLQDVVSVENVNLTSGRLIQTKTQTLTFDVDIVNSGLWPFAPSGLELRACLSANTTLEDIPQPVDGYLSTDLDRCLSPSSVKPKGLMMQPLGPGEVLPLRGLTVEAAVDETDCPLYKYLLVGVRLRDVPRMDDMPLNNYMAVDLPTLCQNPTDIEASVSVGSSVTLSSQSDATVIFIAYVTGLTIPDLFWNNIRLSLDKVVDDEDLLLSLPETGQNVVGPSPPVGPTNHMTGDVRLPNDLDLAYCGRVYAIGEVDVGNHVLELTETNNVFIYPINVACRTTDLMALTVEEASPLTVDLSMPTTLPLTISVHCVQVAALCPASASSAEHMKLRFSLYDWDRQWLVSLMPDELDATNAGSYLSDGELLTGDYSALKIRTAETTGQFVFDDADLCPLVRYLGVSIVKGDSLEIRTKDLGPAASKTRLVPITADCHPRLIDLAVRRFGYVGQAPVVDMGVPSLVVSLVVDVTSMDYPRRPGHQTLFSYKVSATVAGDPSLNVDDIGYVPSEPIMSLLSTDPVTGQLDLTDTNGVADWPRLMALCGRDDVTLGVTIDSYDDYPETNETNNMAQAEGFAQFKNCLDGVDVKLTRFDLTDLEVASGMSVRVDVDVSVVTVGQFPPEGIETPSPLPPLYNVDFALVDSKTQATMELPVEAGVFIADPLRSIASGDVAAGTAKARSHRLNEIRQLPISSDVTLCDRAWFIRARVQLNMYPGIPMGADADLNPEDNVMYRHIYIHCPEDGVALYDVRIMQFPERLWYDSLEYVDFELCVINKGPSIPSPELTFMVTLLFSAFDDVGRAEDEEYKVYTPDEYVYDFRGGLQHGQVYCTGPLQGRFSISSQEVCEKALTEEGSSPNIFFRIDITSEMASMFSPYTGNDIRRLTVNKESLICNQDNVDLMVYAVRVGPGHSGDILAGSNSPYAIELRQKHSLGGNIPRSNPLDDNVSLNVTIYLSNDCGLDPYDDPIPFNYTSEQFYTLKSGVQSSSASTITLEGQNLKIDIKDRLDFSVYCGSSYMLVQVSDLTHINNQIDPVPENNVHCIPINLQCNQDCISFEKLDVKLTDDQEAFHPRALTDFDVRFRIRFCNDASASKDDRQIVNFRVFMSSDKSLDMKADPEIPATFGEDITAMAKQGFTAGEVVDYRGRLQLDANLIVCVFSPEFLIVLVELGAQPENQDYVRNNNYEYIYTKDLLNCSVSTTDIYVTGFDLTVDNLISPGDHLSFNLSARVDLTGSASLGVDEGDQYVFTYQFYLSTDTMVSADDYRFTYSLVDHQTKLKTKLNTGVNIFDLSSQQELLFLPKDIDKKFCGNSYVIAFLDERRDIQEKNEPNNQRAVPVIVICDGDFYSIEDVSMSLQPVYFIKPGFIEMSMTVRTLTGDTSLIGPDEDVMHFRLCIQNVESSDLCHDVTPDTPWAVEGAAVNLTVPPEVGGAVRLERLQNYVDVGPACGAALGRPREGVNRLVVEVRPGGGHNTPGLVDAVSSNSIYMTNVTISCSDEVSDLSVGTFDLLSPEGTSTRILRFGPNPFDLKLAVYTGWRFPIWPPTELPTPQKIYYDFRITLEAEQMLIPVGRLVNVTQNVSLTYNSSSKKDEINKPYTNGQTINLRDTIPGLELPLEKLYQVCLASSIQLEVEIDSRSQQAEINEANNGFTLTGLAPPVDCGSRVDVMVRTFSVPGLTRDTLRPDTAYPYLLEVEVIQTAPPASTAFDLHFFISADRNTEWDMDSNDVTLSVDLSTSQRDSLRADYQGWSVRSVGGAGLIVPLTQETYPLCWRRAFIGVRADPLETVDTVTFTNNVAMFEVILDCTADLDECESGLAACDTNATCHDRPFSLQDPRVGDLSVDTLSSPRSPKYQCVCQQGFRQANQQGTLCHDIAECTELPNGSPLHTCNATLHLQCKEQVGNFSCECTPGFKLEDGVCIDFDECKNDTDNDCHVNAQCNNTLGSYNCTCLPGYQGDGRQCQDTDDCGRDSCLNGGVCVDGVNSFSCTCPPSYTGHRCEVVNGNWGPWGPWSGCDAVCGRGVRSRQRACDDPVPSAQGCGCPVTGGVGATDREDCHDRTCQVGACLLQPCDTPMRCFVTNDEEGARECECPSGYRYNATQQCEDIDECVETTETGVPLNDCCDPYGLCENQPGSFRCPCQRGYDIENGRCMNVDECSAPTSPCGQTNEVCRDTPGSYTCECRPGYRRRTASSGCLGERLLPFGSEVGDLRLNETSRFTGEYVSPLLPVPRGIPLADRLVHALYVSENGAVIGTDQPMDTSFKDTFQRPRQLPTLTLPTDRGVQALLAAFWADAKLNHHSAVWYQAYTDRSQAVFDEVGHLLVSQGVTGFTPTYILKVTWNNTRPHFWAPPEQGVTFQAFVMTDSEMTYFMCIYEEGAMTWLPLYGAQELVLYEGYPAHVGFAARSLDDEMVYYSDPNSGHWNNDLLNTSLNAYRLDGRQLAPLVGGLLGVTLVRADSHGPGYVNPARRCYDWAQAEPPISEWAASLVGACPDVMAKAQIDQRFVPLVLSSTGATTNSTPGSSGITRCFTKLFSLDEGANIRCCYEEGTGAIIDDRLCRSEGEGSHYDSMGVVHRYHVSSDPASPHQLEDAAPYRWCCLQARSTHEEDYAQMYLDRRPAASSHRYDQFGFALAHGDPHYESFDSPTSLTIDGFGEYVLLWRTATPAVMIQARHNKEPPNNRSAEAKRTYISAVAVRVGEQAEPSIQVYLRRDRPDQPLQVVVGTTDWTPNSPRLDNVAISANTNPQTGRLEDVQLVFRAGLVLQVADLGGRLRLVILLPWSLYGEGLWTGLLGSPDFNPNNDLSPSARSGRAQYLDPDPSADIKYIYGQSWTLINVFGDETNAKSLFVKYGPTYIEHSAYQVTITSPEQYDDYYFSPNFYPCTDVSPSELTVCTPPEGGLDCECLHDVRAAGHLEAGRQIMESRSHFNQLKEDLTNHRPEFLNSPSNYVRVQVGETFSMLVTLHDPDDLEVTFNYSVKDPAGRELLVQWVPAVNGSNDTGRIRENVHVFRSTRVGEIFSFNFTWTMTTAEPLFLEFAATDPHGSTTILRPRVSVCDCKNGGSCQNGTPKRGFFTLADCECRYGWAGPTCELDLDGCNTTCFHGCQDVRADLNVTSESQFVCDPCPPGTETDGNSCFQINECAPPTTEEGNDTRAAPCEQVCHKLSDGYTCSCEQGYDIEPNDTSTCIDHPECSSPTLNECDKANGYCVDLPEGSYTCRCNPGYTLASDGHSCRDIDECRTNNGGCEGTCVNKPGSYECRCPAGSRLSDRNPHFCLPVNECEDGSHGCDHECEDTDTGYRCRCRQGYILQTQNGTSCRAQSVCTSTACGPNAYCGLDDVTNVETCYCSNGYRLMYRNLTHCEDIDECAQRVDACDDVTSVCVNVPGKYRCECRAGYKQVGDSPFLCENIDECVETSPAVHGCPMTCRDTIGSYFCTCLPGYSLLREGGVWTCRDIDECSPGHQSPCDPNADCINEVGAYSCVCRQGFTGNGATCTETLECMLSNGGCELRCRDVANGYRCECISGYRQNPNDTTRCLDINECEWPENPCTHICTNQRGIYSCSCRDGFYLDTDGSTCLPDRPCNNECGHGVCSEADNGVKSCNCYSGYTKLQGNLDECKNRIECGRGWQEDKCARDEHTTCVDQTTGRGGYRCQCDPGYTSYGDMLSCKDIDECVTEVVDHQHNCQLNVSTCVNAPGSFSCVCKHGFSMVNDTCTDIDECARRALQDPPCAHYRLATCTNLPGGYLCQCRPGYRGDGLVCQDIDECLMGTCAENQLCVNTPGSYMCECKPGYKFVSGNCENINECLSPTLNNCSRPEKCEDVAGSYRCHCYTEDGAEQLANDGLTCTVLKPCRDPGVELSCGGVCLNQDDRDRCHCDWPQTSGCQDLDECVQGIRVGALVTRPACDPDHSRCVNADPGYSCVCADPWILDPDSRGCSETNGRWGAWSPWGQCSRSCMGSRIRNRNCDEPPPVGLNRYCEGLPLDYSMCNTVQTVSCQVRAGELDGGIFVDFSNMESWHYDKIERYLIEALVLAINNNIDNQSQALLCGDMPQNKVPFPSWLVTADDVQIGRGYPQRLNNTLRVLFVVDDTRMYIFCNKTDTSAQTNSSNPAILTRRRRATTGNNVNSNNTETNTTVPEQELEPLFLLPQSFLTSVLNESEIYDLLDELLYDAQLLDILDLLFPFYIQASYDDRPRTTTPPVVVTEKPPVIPTWAFIVIGVVLGLLLIGLVVGLIVFFVVIKGKKKRKRGGAVGPVHPHTRQPLTDEQKQLVRQKIRERRLRQRQEQLEAEQRERMAMVYGDGDQDGQMEGQVERADNDGAELNRGGSAGPERSERDQEGTADVPGGQEPRGLEGKEGEQQGLEGREEEEGERLQGKEDERGDEEPGSGSQKGSFISVKEAAQQK